MLRNVLWCNVMWWDVMCCDVMWSDVLRCDVMWCSVALTFHNGKFLDQKHGSQLHKNPCFIENALQNMAGTYRAELCQWWAFYTRILSKLKMSHVTYPIITHFTHFKHHIACSNKDVVLRHTSAIIKFACRRTTSLLLREIQTQRGYHTLRYITLNVSIIMMYESSNT